mmetsp:Transcript_21939/g.65767  ORF Transcript_21939/g.65767 Transcript_21939/m.65767 type:complete len:228 (+) Transcript_21939:1030-1713(+)
MPTRCEWSAERCSRLAFIGTRRTYFRPSGDLARWSWLCYGLQEDDASSPTLQERAATVLVRPRLGRHSQVPVRREVRHGPRALPGRRAVRPHRDPRALRRGHRAEGLRADGRGHRPLPRAQRRPPRHQARESFVRGARGRAQRRRPQARGFRPRVPPHEGTPPLDGLRDAGLRVAGNSHVREKRLRRGVRPVVPGRHFVHPALRLPAVLRREQQQRGHLQADQSRRV